MLIQNTIISEREISFERLIESLGSNDIVVAVTPEDINGTWAFYRKEHSVTMFMIEQHRNTYILSMDRLASYDDYRFYPYLIDTLSLQLTDKPFIMDGKGAFCIFNEEWIAYIMGEEVAYLKCILSLGRKYYISLPIQDTNVYISEDALNNMGVTLHSSSPRIFGYVNYMLRHNLLSADDEVELSDTDIETVVDVPQHDSIGTVLSWHTDGSRTTESYSIEDVQLLLHIAESYVPEKHYEGVVLNDIATIYEYGIGTKQDAIAAVCWYKRAIQHGDLLYAPSSLGDIYRRGLSPIEPNLKLAHETYMLSTDPYSWYRIGQSYEEGWTSEPDLEKAMLYYNKAAAAGHHLALKRLECEDEI